MRAQGPSSAEEGGVASILVVGAGKVGRRIAANFERAGGHEVAVADRERSPYLRSESKFLQVDASDQAVTSL
jgi:saccharopine dehydrogenase-like NADP-dependent oxidoreductase